MPGKVRRIVTGVNAAGRSFILSDTMLPTAPVAPGAAVRTGLWTTTGAPASNVGALDPVPDGVILQTPPAHKGGTVVRSATHVTQGGVASDIGGSLATCRL